jgi:hypothetical protein
MWGYIHIHTYIRGSLHKSQQLFFLGWGWERGKNVVTREMEYICLKACGMYLCYHQMGEYVQECIHISCENIMLETMKWDSIHMR